MAFRPRSAWVLRRTGSHEEEAAVIFTLQLTLKN